MNTLLEQDSSRRPELFVWNGSLSKERIEKWLEERQLKLPEDLVELWQETGGGELFESETILGPFGDRD
jgi:hypothetical protein